MKDQFRSTIDWHGFESRHTEMWTRRVNIERKRTAYEVDDLFEPNFDLAVTEVRKCFRVVDEFTELALAHLARSVAKDEKESVDRVRFPASVGANDG